MTSVSQAVQRPMARFHRSMASEIRVSPSAGGVFMDGQDKGRLGPASNAVVGVFCAGYLAGAARAFAAATQALPADGDRVFAAELYENLGLTWAQQGRVQDAIPALLRASW